MENFWKEKSLGEMTTEEWESLCDGCGRCCMIKLEDEETNEVHYTNLVCELLDVQSCRCTNYSLRHELVEDCIRFSEGDLKDLNWLPRSCAYRTIYEGRELAWWHPLVSGSKETVFEAGVAVRGKVQSEKAVDKDLQEEMVIRWVSF